ncbi:citryl-CoA lyase [Steroidobacter sp. S1-65]|uniref:citrate synthase (unknown stereospecificity) n=1 Tax=Steroidobacter gossypii TaxID=2805490 RepID=A0ABS1X110_9GAMM|nr:citryl-CoA lyase [Steroidobacter gossypii]MBM0106936.1 citryl-CoA lyase [Steroidobacter gossypii]
MKIGAQANRASAISTSNAETILVRGRDLCEELIGRISFTDHVWLLVTGDLPNEAQRRVLDAVLVAIAEHGLVPSVQVGRMTLAAAPEALQGAVAAGLLGCGSVILGAAEEAGRLLHEVIARAAATSMRDAASEIIRDYQESRRAIPGYGHPLHKDYDPRARRLLEVARQAGTSGRHIEAASIIDDLLPEITGKPLAMNVSGAIACTLLDAGYPLLALKGAPLLARTASLIAHLLEERSRPIGFVLSHAGALAVEYDGPKPEGFVGSDR